MHLLNLTVENFGLFRGTHSFDLETACSASGSRRPLLVISGHNGAGKSTLFQALAVALHGKAAIGDRLSEQAYSDFLLSRLHRREEPTGSEVSGHGSVALTLRYVQSGRPLVIHVKRCWERTGRRVREDLAVLSDARPPEVGPAEYQAWLNDLIPSSLGSLLSFDAERLDAFASPEQHNGALGEVLHRLLGLDVVDRLVADLDYQLVRRGGGRHLKRLRREVLEQQVVFERQDNELARLEAASAVLETERAECQRLLAKEEERFVAEGGPFAERRPELQKRHTELQVEIGVVSEELRELAANLLPFALAPELCRRLEQQLIREGEYQRLQVARDLWEDRVNTVQLAIDNDEFWAGARVSRRSQRIMTDHILSLLRNGQADEAAEEFRVLHYLADPERERLLSWIKQASEVVPQQVRTIQQHLHQLQQEESEIRAGLDRAPDEGAIAPIYERIQALRAQLEELRNRQNALREQIGTARFKREEDSRKLEQTKTEIAATERVERELALARRSKAVLLRYRDALLIERLAELEEALVRCFNAICRKEHLVRKATITDDFSIGLYGSGNQDLSLSSLSAGERQLYALALLQALREVSGRQLPLLIDTPLARLDEHHRRRVVQSYLPHVSEQVILFATDAEATEGLLAQIEESISRVYRLTYDPEQHETLVSRHGRLALTSAPLNEEKLIHVA